ncbi:neutral invertase 1 [Canna indica]|uniref:Neutral invertase 1 n=1 Tax=Canna indica TaxID=4628 RepID=A0AAQ3QLU9_9LILI|nr:neutral invertase 1 [Canna indica]
MNGFKEPAMRNVGSYSSMSDANDLDFSRLPDRSKLSLERQRSCDEKSMNELF